MFDRPDFLDSLNAGGGIFSLELCWVPRSFMISGARLRLHPDNLYALGTHWEPDEKIGGVLRLAVRILVPWPGRGSASRGRAGRRRWRAVR
jgi:hypothetical protein